MSSTPPTIPGATPPAADDPAAKDALIAELREEVRARDDFVAMVAHELRNPLTPIVMLADVLRAAADAAPEPLPAGMAEKLLRLHEAVQRYLRRTDLLLEVSRFTSGGGLRLDPGRFDLSAVLRETLAAVAPLAARMRTEIVAEIAADLVGEWDRIGVEQVAENLLSNALKYGAGRPVTVSLGRDAGAGLVRLRVQDRGIGISVEDQARIFGRFERAVGRREHGGLGVGLWVARQTAQAMGGEIAVESRPGEGSIFTLTLPMPRESEPNGQG